MQIHYLQHVHFEGPGNISTWADQQGHRMSGTKLYAEEPLPFPEDVDLLLILGGPMNVCEHNAYPWLIREKQFIKSVIHSGAAVLGICLGAQLLADVLGGSVSRNKEKEIGWHPVNMTDNAFESPLFNLFPRYFIPFHWHGDTFSIPLYCQPIAYSEVCENQAFQYSDRVVGLQFHLEYTTESIQSMILNCGNELTEEPYVQAPEKMLAYSSYLVHNQQLLFGLLSALENQYCVGRARVAEISQSMTNP
jgi:GMP synthase-like glutamine amidotransferase